MIAQVSVFLENKSGRLAELTRVLGDAGINMRALMVADTSEFGVVRIVCDRPHAAVSALEGAGFGASLTDVVAIEVPDRPGGLADVLDVLGSEGLNVEYAYCFIDPSGSAAVDIVRVEDSARAAAALRSADIVVREPETLYSLG